MTVLRVTLVLLVALVLAPAQQLQKRQAQNYQRRPQAYYRRPSNTQQTYYNRQTRQSQYRQRQPAYYQKPAAQPAYYQQPAAQPAYYQQPAAQPAYYQQPAAQPAYYQQPAAQPAYYQQPAAQPAYYQPQPAYRQPAANNYQPLVPPPAPQFYQPELPQDTPKPKKKEGQDLSKVPGRAGVDYPIYHEVPDTKFHCGDVPTTPGIYANVDTGCQAYHVCHDGREGHQGASFLCPNGTIFNQHEFSCDWWYNVNCAEAPTLYSLNSDPLKNPYAPKPKKEDALTAEPDYYHP